MNRKLTVLIVDDEKDSRDILKFLLKDINDIQIIDEAENAETALFKFLDRKPDLVLLDLVMPGKNGIEFIELLKKQKIDTNIVIVSAHGSLAIEAIKNGVYDFLLKPVVPAQLNNIIKKIKSKKEESNLVKLDTILNNVKNETKLMLNNGNNQILIDPEEIIFCEVIDGLIHIHLENGEVELATVRLGKLEEVLANSNFFRIRRALMINLDKLWRANRMDNSCILLANKKEIKLYGSKKQIKELCNLGDK